MKIGDVVGLRGEAFVGGEDKWISIYLHSESYFSGANKHIGRFDMESRGLVLGMKDVWVKVLCGGVVGWIWGGESVLRVVE